MAKTTETCPYCLARGLFNIQHINGCETKHTWRNITVYHCLWLCPFQFFLNWNQQQQQHIPKTLKKGEKKKKKGRSVNYIEICINLPPVDDVFGVSLIYINLLQGFGRCCFRTVSSMRTQSSTMFHTFLFYFLLALGIVFA